MKEVLEAIEEKRVWCRGLSFIHLNSRQPHRGERCQRVVTDASGQLVGHGPYHVSSDAPTSGLTSDVGLQVM